MKKDDKKMPTEKKDDKKVADKTADPKDPKKKPLPDDE